MEMVATGMNYLTPKEYAQLVRVHVKTVLAWIRQGKLPGVKFSGNTVRIPRGATPKTPS